VKRNLAHMYDRLTSEERFRLVVEAFAREDQREVERFSNTCPRKVYEMNDLAFSSRLTASDLIVSRVYAELVEALSTLRAIEACREAVEAYEELLYSSLERATEEAALSFHQGWDAGCDHAWEVAGKHGPFPWNVKGNLSERAQEMAQRIRDQSGSEASDDASQETLEKVGDALSVRAQTIWVAFSRFCHEQLGLKPETALRACFPLAFGLPEQLSEAVGSVRADPVLLEDYEAMLNRAWRELVGK
jgi:hypothetical protein